MQNALLLLAVLGAAGAFDTLYYHEYRYRLPRQRTARRELALHAARDFVYALLFATLGRTEWRGAWAVVLAALVAAEIVITMTDFVIESFDRKPLGDVAAGERVTHGLMGICYGAMLANLWPVWRGWATLPTALTASHAAGPLLGAILLLMSIGVFASGMRDAYAAYGMR